ncbi:hypothetical protein EDB86DRAFT_3079692 [Lactarius hatsudake]|nr:hypothetical protein EDB86DRAFT_3079692 [Lactarius hatsudake]
MLPLPLMFYNADIYREEKEAAAAAAALCFISILEARDARMSDADGAGALSAKESRTRILVLGYPGKCSEKARKTARATTRRTRRTTRCTPKASSTSDDGFSHDDDDDDGDDDDDDEPPAERRAAPATTKKATFETSESGSDVDIANDPAVNGDDEDSEDDLAGKRKSPDNDDEDSDAYIRSVKKAKTATQTTMMESFEKNPAGGRIASKTTTVCTASGSTLPPPKNTHIQAVETSDIELLMGEPDSVPIAPRAAAKVAYIELSDDDDE